jgi:Ubiquitin-2 like Rad60 SUMO-like
MINSFRADLSQMQATGYPASVIAAALQQKYSAGVLAAIAGVAVAPSWPSLAAAPTSQPPAARAPKAPRAAAAPDVTIVDPVAKTIQVTVVAELVEPGTSSSKDDAATSASTTTTQLCMDESDKLTALAAKLLEALKLPAGGGVVTFKSESQTLYLKHTARDCNLSSGCTLHAKVHLISSLLRDSNASSISAAASSINKKKLGRSLSIQLRRSSGETVTVKTYQKQPFQAVMDEFVRQAKGTSSHAANAVYKFKFDGDFLNLQSDTPEGLDMDDDDLIDVVEA